MLELKASEEKYAKLLASHDQLVISLNNAEKEITRMKSVMETLTLERDTALQGQLMTKTELKSLNERFAKSQEVWLATSRDLDAKEAQLNARDQQIRELNYEIDLLKKNCSRFREEIALLLSDDYVKVEPDDDEIKEKLRLLMFASKERANVSCLLNICKYDKIFNNKLISLSMNE